LLAQNSREDLERCIQSICRYSGMHSIELVIIDNGSTDDTLAYLEGLARQGELKTGQGKTLALQVFFADHNLGFAAGRNATMRASRGHAIVILDTSIELHGDIWKPLGKALQDEHIGVVGPYGLVTDDLREFREIPEGNADAIEGYLMAFRKALLPEIGWVDEKFRFYRLMDVYMSFFFKTSGYYVMVVPEVAERIIKHMHREWYSLSEEEQATKSKKNYDIFHARWHHGESLLVKNYLAEQHWFGHDHPYHLEGDHTHSEEELPPPGVMHIHVHQHWPDHSHTHLHYHNVKNTK
jgi:glycosyltransferase involved in cell wall biosynthesis